MWKPVPGAFVDWHFPGPGWQPGQPPFPILPRTRFTGEGDISTANGFAHRYGLTSDMMLEGVVRPHLPVEAEELGTLGQAIARAASDPHNPWGLTPEQLPLSDTELYDFSATALGSRGIATIADRYPANGNVGDWPVKPTDSQDASNPTHGRWNRPTGLFSITQNGGTWWYFNDLWATNTPPGVPSVPSNPDPSAPTAPSNPAVVPNPPAVPTVLTIPANVLATLRAAPGWINIPKGKNRGEALYKQLRLKAASAWAEEINGKSVR